MFMKFQIIMQEGHNLLNIDDLPILLGFNDTQDEKIKNLSENKRQNEIDAKILTELLPEPFIGNPNAAKVLLLALNPGFQGDAKNNIKGERYWHSHEKFKKLIFDNINFIDTDYPYYYLNNDEAFLKTPGYIWCKRIFKELINAAGGFGLSKKICCVQFHGYHSKRYKYLGDILPSQRQTFDLIKSFMKTNSPIVIMRSKNIWFDAIKGLQEYENKIILRNPRNPTLSKRNMGEGDFQKLLDSIKQNSLK